MARFQLPGRPLQKLWQIAITGNPTDPNSKGMILSKTGIFATGGFVYTLGLGRGWWDPDSWETVVIPAVTYIGTLIGRWLAKKNIG